MRNRAMRTIVFFDLPSVYAKDKRNYFRFRKFLINEGFIMLQESVYSKLLLNLQQLEYLTKKIERNSPKEGIVQVLTVTEKQYSQMKYIIGDKNNKIINNEERLLVL